MKPGDYRSDMPYLSCTTIVCVVVILVTRHSLFFVPFGLAPIFGLEIRSFDAEAEQKAEESDTTEDTKGEGFTFRLKLGRGREQGPGDEWSNRSSCCGECLCQTIYGAENRVIRRRIGDLVTLGE